MSRRRRDSATSCVGCSRSCRDRQALIRVVRRFDRRQTCPRRRVRSRWCGGKNNVILSEAKDLIESRLPWIVQVQVNEKAGFAFATASRSIMRQDPDVMLVGEIRDRETAEIAVQASLTAPRAVDAPHQRRAERGDAAHQHWRGELQDRDGRDRRRRGRLVRRTCSVCAGREGERCGLCAGTGFYGRLALLEVLITNAAFEHCVTEGGRRSASLISREPMGTFALTVRGVARDGSPLHSRRGHARRGSGQRRQGVTSPPGSTFGYAAEV